MELCTISYEWKPPYGGVSGVWVYSLCPGDHGPKTVGSGLGAWEQDCGSGIMGPGPGPWAPGPGPGPRPWARKAKKFDSTIKMKHSQRTSTTVQWKLYMFFKKVVFLTDVDGKTKETHQKPWQVVFLNIGLNQLSKTLCFWASARKSYQQPYVFEGQISELREWSLSSNHKTLNFDRGLNFDQICPQRRIPQIP